MDLEHGRFTQLNEGDLEHYLEGLSLEATLPARETLGMPQYRIPNAARADIVDILTLSQTQFGDQARQRYQALIISALQAIVDTPYRIGSHDRDELAPGLCSYHLIHSR